MLKTAIIAAFLALASSQLQGIDPNLVYALASNYGVSSTDANMMLTEMMKNGYSSSDIITMLQQQGISVPSSLTSEQDFSKYTDQNSLYESSDKFTAGQTQSMPSNSYDDEAYNQFLIQQYQTQNSANSNQATTSGSQSDRYGADQYQTQNSAGSNKATTSGSQSDRYVAEADKYQTQNSASSNQATSSGSQSDRYVAGQYQTQNSASSNQATTSGSQSDRYATSSSPAYYNYDDIYSSQSGSDSSQASYGYSNSYGQGSSTGKETTYDSQYSSQTPQMGSGWITSYQQQPYLLAGSQQSSPQMTPVAPQKVQQLVVMARPVSGAQMVAVPQNFGGSTAVGNYQPSYGVLQPGVGMSSSPILYGVTPSTGQFLGSQSSQIYSSATPIAPKEVYLAARPIAVSRTTTPRLGLASLFSNSIRAN